MAVVEEATRDYRMRFVVKVPNVKPFAYLKDKTTWLECVEGIMSFVKSLDDDSTHLSHVPVYNLNYTIEMREAYIYNITVTWASEACVPENLAATVQWYIEDELKRVIRLRYRVKPVIRVRSVEDVGRSSTDLVPVGYEAILCRFTARSSI